MIEFDFNLWDEVVDELPWPDDRPPRAGPRHGPREGWGFNRRLGDGDIEVIQEMLDARHTWKEIADQCRASVAQLQYAVAKLGLRKRGAR